MKKTYLTLSILVALAALGFAAWLYPELPARIPIHWNAAGQADGWGPRAAIFWPSGLILITMILCEVLPKLSPKRFSLDDFASTWRFSCFAVNALLAYIQCVHAWAVYTGAIAIERALIVGLALFFALSGNVAGKVRRNFWLGIRTPWTLASERVWYATHRLAARSMVLGAALALVLLYLRAPAGAAFAVLMGSVIVPALWSLVYYKRLERSGSLEA
jgi:uncharacterized membrane protein